MNKTALEFVKAPRVALTKYTKLSKHHKLNEKDCYKH